MNSYDQRHRNAHPDDRVLFDDQHLLRMQKAVYELCWLFNRGYSRHSAIKFVGELNLKEDIQVVNVKKGANLPSNLTTGYKLFSA